MRWTRTSILCAAVLAAVPASAEAGGLGSVVGAVASAPGAILGGLLGGGKARQPRHHARHVKSQRSVARAAPAVAAPVVTAPVVTAPAVTAPVVTAPAVAPPVVARVAPATPAEIPPAESRPGDIKPTDIKPAETRPTETKPADRATAAFWSSAYDDVFGYVLSSGGYGDAFWLRGYADVVEAMFAPSAAAMPRDKRGRAGTSARTGNANDVLSASTCAEAPTAAAVIERIEGLVRPTAAQRDALRELADALQAAAARFGAACAMDVSGGPGARLETMWRRLRAMRQAVILVRAPLRNFYETLNEEQRARLDAAAPGEPGMRAVSDRFLRACNESARMPEWPVGSIAQTVQLNEDQRPMLELLMGTALHYAHQLRDACSAAPAPLTSTTRLEAVDQRLTAIVYALTVLRGTLNRFYNSLTEDQRARFDAMNPRPAERRRADLP